MKSNTHSYTNLFTNKYQSLSVSVFYIFMIISISLGLTNKVQAETTITNTASVAFKINGDSRVLSDSVQFTKDTAVTASDEISLDKKASATTIIVGDLVTYTLTINNPNTNSLTNVKIEDTLPSGVSFTSGTVKQNDITKDTTDVQLSGFLLKIFVGDIPANSTVKITYQVKTTAIGVHINQAYALSDTVNSLKATATISISTKPPAKPKTLPLSLNKEADKSRVKLGDIIHFTLSYSNENKTAINNASISDELPTELSYLVGSAILNGKAFKADLSKGLSFNLGNIPAETSGTLEYDVKVNNANKGVLINRANINASDSSASSNTATASVNISNEEIILSKTVNKQKANVGDVLVYTINVSNPHKHPLSNLILNDVLPTGFDYKVGTATVNGNTLPASKIQINDRNLDFIIGALAKKQSISLTYEVIVTDKAIPGDAVNTVSANSLYALSQAASSSIKVRTPSIIEFLKITPTLEITKKIIPTTSFNDNQNGGKHWENITKITLRDGSIIDLTETQPLENTDQYTISDPIVIQVTDLDQNTDPDAIETIIVTITVPGTNDKEILLLRETAPNSGIFRGILATTLNQTKLQNGVLSLSQGSKIGVSYFDEEDQTDTSATAALVIPEAQLVLSKSSGKQSATIGEQVRYTLTFKNTTDFIIPNIIIKDTLPIGFHLIPNTSLLNNIRINEKTANNGNGRNLIFNLGEMSPNEEWSLEYLTKVTGSVQIGDAINTARIDSNKFKSNIASAKITIKDDLMRSKNILTGRVYIGCKAGKAVEVLKGARIYLETGRNILSDKEGFWHMEGVKPGKHVLQIDTTSLSDSYEPIVCDDNTRFAGNLKSRFIDLQAGSLWRVDFHVKKVTKDKASKKISKKKIQAINPADLFNTEYLESTSGNFDILWPKNNYVPAIASIKIYIQNSPKQKVDVYLNGKKVSALNYDGSETNKARSATIRRWFGVDIDIKKRDNTLLAILKDKSGKEIARKTRNIHFSSNPASAEYIEEDSILIADGKTTPVITLQIKDEEGFPMRANTHGYFTLKNSRFSVKNKTSSDGELNLNKSTSGNYKYQIEEGGIARIELNPTTQSGQIQLELNFPKTNNKTISAWLKPQLREWILVGIAEGSVGYNTISGNLQTLKDIDKSDKFYKRGRVAFFAKGKIKGQYLLTLAYDTHKQKHQAGYQLNGDINPDSWYTIYADNSHSQYDAPSSRKLYVKLEKETFYAVFGDYSTGMNVTELAKFERTLNGIKSEYKGKNLSYNTFISETSNNHHHDEINGDGTSGLYYLSSSIIPNSETIRIETRNRFHSETILETRELVRYQDYEIDYDAGTLFFKFPINGRNSNFDPNIIIVDYDSESDSNKSIVVGGRIAVNTNNQKLELGVSAINIGNNATKDDSLVAIDATYKINSSTKIKAEVATTKTKAGDHKAASAQILELRKQTLNTEAKVYYRKQMDNFGIDSQASEIGTKKIGAVLKYKLSDKTTITSELSKQNNLTNNNERQLSEINLTHRNKQYEVKTGVRHTKEELDSDTKTSDTFLLGGKYTTENGKLTLRGNIEKNLKSNNQTEQSPDRALVGVDVKLKHGVTLFAEHEITQNNSIDTQNSRLGLSKTLWKGATGKTTFTQQQTDHGQTNYATLGVNQKIKLGKNIIANFSLDHAKTIGNSSKRFNNNESVAQGAQRDDYLAFSVGLGSNHKEWNWSTRIESRNGEINDKINYNARVTRQFKNGKNLSASLTYSDSQSNDGDYSTTTRLTLASAWHPKEKDFNFFSRLDLTNEKSRSKDVKIHTRKILHNMHYNRKINKNTQFSIHHGIKHIVDENKNAKNHATIDTATLELRKDITKKWDIGAHVGYLHDWTESNLETVAGISVGVTPAKNAWLQLGYNFEGFADDDFDGNDYKREGVYLSFSYKFDQDSFRRKNEPKTITTKNKQ